MSGNVRGGNYSTTKENAMKAFDKLPPEVRSALANAAEDWVPQPFLTWLRRGSDVKALVAIIGSWDARELARREHDRSTARGVYKGNQPDSKPVRAPWRQGKRR